jgi:hypothetical protein
MTLRQQIDHALGGLVGDLDQQHALCVELIAALHHQPRRLSVLCGRVARLADSADPVAEALGHFAALGIFQSLITQMTPTPTDTEGT